MAAAALGQRSRSSPGNGASVAPERRGSSGIQLWQPWDRTLGQGSSTRSADRPWESPETHQLRDGIDLPGPVKSPLRDQSGPQGAGPRSPACSLTGPGRSLAWQVTRGVGAGCAVLTSGASKVLPDDLPLRKTQEPEPRGPAARLYNARRLARRPKQAPTSSPPASPSEPQAGCKPSRKSTEPVRLRRASR